MGKKIFWNGKKVLRDQLSDSELMLDSMLKSEKKLTARWYARISGTMPWAVGERESIHAEMDALEIQIDHAIGRQELKIIA